MHIRVEKPNDHHTENYNYYYPILRRGNSFQIKCNSHKFKFYRNKEPTINLTINNYNVKVSPSGVGRENDWKYTVKSKGDEYGCITIGINIPADAIIGKYLGRVSYTDNDEDNGFFSFILFYNPWNPRDVTYMKDSNKLNEYILNEYTKIYMGSRTYYYGTDWYLGQFQTPCIEATLILLQRIPANELNNPISVSRYMSALVNSNDDNGIVMGNWNGTYGDGTNPSAWRSSVEILRKYANNKYPVKYGQCWVFGAILCTICRCVGIPNRIITAFDAFHDGNKSLEWEIYYDENLNLLNTGYDSCWNFHIWTEVWLNRYDLGIEYSGWQILDATPQERSGGIFRIGPAPRYAVKEGYVKVNYDVDFVFAEVNADKVHYVRRKNGKFVPFKIEKDKVSTKILTKKIGNNNPRDIINDYKYPDGSVMDKIIDSRIMEVNGRTHLVESSRIHNDSDNSDFSTNKPPRIRIKSVDKVRIGDNFFASISVNSSNEFYLNGHISTSFMLVAYNGKIAATILEDKQNLSHKRFKKSYKIEGKLISKKIKNEITILKIIVTIMTTEGKFSTKTQSVCLIKPTLSLKFSNNVVDCFKSTNAIVTINNSLLKKIKNAKLYIESSCLTKRVGRRIDDIDKNSTIEYSIKIKPTKSGNFSVWAYLDSESISGLHVFSHLSVN